MEELNLELNHTYLLRYGCTDTLHSITVLLISDKAYKVRWNGSGAECWELKRRMDSDYTLVEDISDFVANEQKEQPLVYNITTTLVQCPSCGGTGNVQDFGNTSGTKLCPRCLGSKMIPEIVEIKS